MRNFLNNLFNSKKLNKKNASTKLELLNLEARLTPSTAQPIIPGQGSLNDFTAIGADSGGGPLVTVTFNNTDTLGNGPQYLSFFAYDPSFTGGVRVALGDVNGDGNRDIITAAGPSGSPHIKVFTINHDLVTGDYSVNPQPIAQFYAFNQPTFKGGVYIAAGNLDQGAGITDLIVGTTNNQFGVILNNEPTGIPVTNVFAGYNGTIRAGVARDANGREVAVALAGPGGAPRISIFSFQTSGLTETESAFVIPPKISNGGTFSMFGNPSVGYFTGGLFGTPTL